MMRWLLALVPLLSALPALAQTPTRLVYVSSVSSGGDGSSWTQAYSTLNDALANAQAGDAIIVGSGLYTTQGGNAALALPGNLFGIFGGWQGNEAITPTSFESALAARPLGDTRNPRDSGEFRPVIGPPPSSLRTAKGAAAVITHVAGTGALVLDGVILRGAGSALRAEIGSDFALTIRNSQFDFNILTPTTAEGGRNYGMSIRADVEAGTFRLRIEDSLFDFNDGSDSVSDTTAGSVAVVTRGPQAVADVVVTRSTFSLNRIEFPGNTGAPGSGGALAVWTEQGSATVAVTNSLFRSNTAGLDPVGGAGLGGSIHLQSATGTPSSPGLSAQLVANQFYSGGGERGLLAVTAVGGGAIRARVESNLFAGGGPQGAQVGAVYVGADAGASAQADLDLVTAGGNRSSGAGAAVTAEGTGASVTVNRSVLWDNASSSSGLGAQVAALGGASVSVAQSVVQGGSEAPTPGVSLGAGVSAADPGFVQSVSPSDNQVDDLPSRADFRITQEVVVRPGGARDPVPTPAVDAVAPGDLPLDVADADSDGITSEPSPLDAPGQARVQNGAANWGAVEATFVRERIDGPFVYVRKGSSGTGASWSDALGSLAQAVSAARPNQPVLVARGRYLPSDVGDVEQAFELTSGAQIYGGWAGNESVTPATLAQALSRRDVQADETILSGDLNADDVAGNDATRSDNSWQVVRLRVTSSDSVVVDGVTIRDGDGRGGERTDDPLRSTGGMLVTPSLTAGTAFLTLRDVRFAGNTRLSNRFTSSGADFNVSAYPIGSANRQSFPLRLRVERVTVNGIDSRNGLSIGQGDLEYLGDLQVDMRDVRFAPDNAGRIRVSHTGQTASAVRMSRIDGTTVFVTSANSNATSLALDVVLEDSRAGLWVIGRGRAGIRARARNVLADRYDFFFGSLRSNSDNRIVAELDNVTLAGGISASFSGSQNSTVNSTVDLTVRNSIIARQSSSQSGAYFQSGIGPGTNVTVRFEHSLLEASGPNYENYERGSEDVTFVDDGGNLLNTDPLFVDRDALAGSEPDYGLSAGSPAIDAGTLPLPADLLDQDGDGDTAEPLPFDLAGNERLDGNAPDMGAYEGSSAFRAEVAIARADAYPGGIEDQALVVPASSGVLANDTLSTGGRPASAELVAPAPPGVQSLDFRSDGSFTVTPLADASGPYSFFYWALNSNGERSADSVEVVVTFSPVPDAPVALADTLDTLEDTPLSIGAAQGVLVNDRDDDGDPIEAVLVTDVSSGTLNLSRAGEVTYTPNPNFNGEDSFTYRARETNGTAESSPVTVLIRVAAVDDLPAAQGASYDITRDQTLEVAAPGLLAFVTDVEETGPDRDVRTFAASSPANGTVTVSTDGSFTYTPTSGFVGTDTFDYAAQDTSAQRDTATVTITVSLPPLPPTARADAYTLEEEGALATTRFSTATSEPGVLFNDDDPNGDAFTAVRIDSTANGRLFLASDGTFTYEPNPDFAGTDAFSYAAQDPGGLRDTALVTLTVTNVPDAPVARDDAASGGQGQVLVGSVRTNDTDADGDTLRITLASQTPATQTLGTLDLATNGAFRFTPQGSRTGTARYLYTATDPSGRQSSAFLDIEISNSVADAPIATDDRFDGIEDQTLTEAAPGVLAGDTDADDDPLTAALVEGPRWGTLDLRGAGSFDFVPAADSSGVVTFRYAAVDPGGLRDTATITLDIAPRDDAPIGGPDAYTIDEDGFLDILAASANSLLQNDRSPDGLTVASFEAILADSTQNGELTRRLAGSEWTGGFTYRPNPNFNGSDGFTYRVRDSRGLVSDPVAVTITVNPIADELDGVADRDTTREDTPLDVAAPGVLANDPNPDSVQRTVRLVDDSQVGGTVALQPDGAFTFTPDENYNSFAVRADGVQVSTGTGAQFAYEIVWPGGTVSAPVFVSVAVSSVNDAPAAADDAYETFEDTPIGAPFSRPVASILLNDTDADANSAGLTPFVVQDAQLGAFTLEPNGTFSYVPNPDVSGVDSVGYRVHDTLPLGPGGSPVPGDTSAIAWVRITVEAVADAPVAVADTFRIDEDQTLTLAAPGVLANDTRGDGATLTVSQVLTTSFRDAAIAGSLTLDTDGRLTYTPTLNVNGTQRFYYYVTDETGTRSVEPALVVVEVTPVNDLPVLVAGSRARITATEDTPLVIARVPGSTDVTDATNPLNLDTDVEDGFAVTGRVVDQPENATVSFGPDGTLTITPLPNATTFDDSFTYLAVDSEGAESAGPPKRVNLTIRPVNDPPIARNDTLTIAEDTTLEPPAFLANDSDDESDFFLANDFQAQGDPSFNVSGAIRTPNGRFTRDGYTPNPDFAGVDSFRYVIRDFVTENGVRTPNLFSDSATVYVTITPVPDAPRPNADAFSAQEDATFTGNVLANDSDPEADIVSARLFSGPSRGRLDLRADGTFDLSLPPDSFGVVTFSYEALDATNLASAPAQVTVTFANTADAPRVSNEAYATDEDTPLVVAAPGLLRNDEDVDELGLEATLIGSPRLGTAQVASDGRFVYTPNPNAFGRDTLRYRVASPLPGATAEAQAVIEIRPVADVPVARADLYADLVEEQVFSVAAAQGVLANDTDGDGDDLTAEIVEAPRWGTLALGQDGGFTFEPAANSTGEVRFRYAATDGALRDTATVTLVIGNVNDAPVAGAVALNGIEDQTLTLEAPGLLAFARDPDGDDLSASLVGASPSWGSVTVGRDGRVEIVPATALNGSGYTFQYAVSDGVLRDTATVTVTFEARPDVPVAQDDAYATTEDAALTVLAAEGVLSNDADADGDALTAALVSQPVWGEVVLAGDGSFVFAPAADSSGSVTFTYSASDGALLDTAAVTLTIAPLADAPIARADTVTALQAVLLDVPAPGVLANDTDAEGDTLTVQLVTDAANGSLDLRSDGSFTYTADARFSGEDRFTYQATDGALASAPVEGADPRRRQPRPPGQGRPGRLRDRRGHHADRRRARHTRQRRGRQRRRAHGLARHRARRAVGNADAGSERRLRLRSCARLLRVGVVRLPRVRPVRRLRYGDRRAHGSPVRRRAPRTRRHARSGRRHAARPRRAWRAGQRHRCRGQSADGSSGSCRPLWSGDVGAGWKPALRAVRRLRRGRHVRLRGKRRRADV